MDGAAGPATADSGAQGRGAERRRLHEEGLAPLVWLALGCALGWQGKVYNTGTKRNDDIPPMRAPASPDALQRRHGPVLSGPGQ